MNNKELLKELKKKVKKYGGDKCKDFSICCWNCLVWMAYEIIEDMLYGWKEE